MAFTKAKIVMAGLAVTAVCIVAPQQLKAQVPEAQMDGVMGQSIEDETVYESKPRIQFAEIERSLDGIYFLAVNQNVVHL